MKTHKNILQVDYVIQLILLILLGASALPAMADKNTILFFGVMLFFTGVWQFLSGIVMGIIRKDEKRGQYVLGSIFYIFLLAAGTFILDDWNISGGLGILLAIIFIAIIPCIIAVWYFRHTMKDLKKLREDSKSLVKVDERMKDILDSEEIFKPKL